MKSLIILVVIVLVTANPQHKPISPRAGILFGDCQDSVCESGRLRGLECRLGRCRIICYDGVCFKNKLTSTRTSADTGVSVHVKHSGSLSSDEKRQAQNETRPLSLFVKYDNCTAGYCTQGDHEGYNCNDGLCSIICKRNNCYQLEIID